jgi:hypothetical protein
LDKYKMPEGASVSRPSLSFGASLGIGLGIGIGIAVGMVITIFVIGTALIGLIEEGLSG